MNKVPRRILFLDIDGVVLPLSRQARRRYEDYEPGQRPKPLDLLVQLLEKHTDLELVLSSSWRMDLGLEVARTLLPEHLRHRLIDSTPVINGGRDRAVECTHWRYQHAPTARFAIVDDCAELFRGYGLLPQLVLVDPCVGLDANALEDIRQRIYGYDTERVSPDWSMPSERTRLEMLWAGLDIRRVFQSWQLTSDEQRLLVDVSISDMHYELTEETWPSFRTRIEKVEQIELLLQSLFPANRDLRTRWIKTPNKAKPFGGRTPFEVMSIDGDTGIESVLSYLQGCTQMNI